MVAAIDDRHRIHLLESAVFATRMNIESSRQATSHIDVSELGRSIQEMPSFKDEAPVRDLLPPLTAEQWAAFFEDLGMQEQPDGTAWVKPLSQKERDARQACKLRGSLYYASTAPSGTFRAPGYAVQLAVGWILRALESASMTRLRWRDTRVVVSGTPSTSQSSPALWRLQRS